MDTIETIKLTFFQECEEQLAELESGLLAMNEGAADSETVNAVFRAVHSIKGGAGAFKLDDLVRFAHIFETTLDQIRIGQLPPSPEVMKVVLRTADVLADLVAAAREGDRLDEAKWLPALEECRALSDASHDAIELADFQPVRVSFDDIDAPVAPARPPRVFTIYFKPKRELYANANESVLLLRELARLGEMTVACDASALPLLGELDADGAYFAWTVELVTTRDEAEIREVFEFVEGDCDLTIEGAAIPAPAPSDVAALIRRVQAEMGAESRAPAFVQRPAPVHANAPLKLVADAAPSEGRSAAPPAKADIAKNEIAPPAATIRVEFDRVDRLINLVGELVINQAMLSQRIIEAGFANGSAVTVGLDELEQLTREIQESVMAIRAQPVKSLFQRMSRIVREVADATGKSARLKTEGESTEIDKTVVERLADPLTHLIRNAIDHGLEAPHSRAAAGKLSEGIVRLSAAHRSGRVIIEVADDGAGIDRARVRDVAIGKGLIPADAQLTDAEIDNLIFLPGFSTVSELSNISGRGVGMDVVKRSIQALGGRISIASRPGKGSTFTMSLPLTLAVLDGMVVSTSGQTLVVPLTAIVETLRPKSGDVHALGSGADVLAIRGSFVPLIDVGRALGFRTVPADPLTSVVILIETEGRARNALLVDTIQDQRQVVIKSLEANYCHVPDIAAATILGDGRVALILDVDALVARSRGDVAPADLPFAEAG
ncbi:chemotaxis protein CheA [Methylocapsa sp. S129]|uniref:chemotaxis protein CheA n=1 Tax=Methylocapsa sp. S129 TaxID=1641869 RepID=UPI00131DF388|nr:chemotaxis protein CheA [Methylocapsa sp. S129]